MYNPSLFDLASDIEEDPLSFLNNPMPTSSTSTPDASPVASSSASAVKSSNKSGPSPAKHLRLSIKKELDDYDELNTPQISPSNSTKPVFRGKKRGNWKAWKWTLGLKNAHCLSFQYQLLVRPYIMIFQGNWHISVFADFIWRTRNLVHDSI